MTTQIIEGFRLSPQQHRLWRLQQVAPGQPYRTSCVVLIEGKLDEQRFGAALAEVVHRHEVLRTVFRALPGMRLPLQVVQGSGSVTVNNYDLSGWSPKEQAAEVERLDSEGCQLLDFESGPLLRASLIKLEPDNHILLVHVSALCADGGGLANLLGELSRSYAGGASEEPTQYVAVAEWLNELIESDEAEVGREYWRKQCNFDPRLFTLPFEQHPGDHTSFEPRSLALDIARETAAQIEVVCRRQAISTSAFFMACWQSLLWRLSGEPEFVVGMACDGRTHEELAGALGLFERYVPIGCRLESETRFDEMSKQVSQLLQDAYSLQECFSWEQIERGEWAQGAPPFFPFCFDFGKAPAAYEAAGLRFSLSRLQSCTDRFALRFSILQGPDSFSLRLDYDQIHFTHAQVKRMGAQLRMLLADACEHPRALVGELELLDGADWRRQVLEWEERARTYPRLRLHELFEQQAAETPDRVALVAGELAVTYAELNRGAERVAARLRRLGVGPEVVVAMYLERSPAQVEALLGVLKAGGAYLPLERAYPRERLRFMLADAAVPVIVTQAEWVAELPESEALVVCLGAEEREADHAGVRSASGWATGGAETLAYVIYTSGSTGEPKGAMLPHAGVVNCVQWMQETYQLRASDRFLFKTPLGFDPSVWEVFWTLGVGATVVVARAGGEMDSTYLAEVIKQEQVTSVYFVPGMLGAYLEERGAGWGQMRRVICGGEALPAAVLERFYEVSGSAVELHHSYGPTEVSIAATEWVCERGARVQMGHGLANTRVYVLDGRGRAVGEGVAGELYLGGAGVGRGYLNRPGQTGERFVPDPFAGAAGARMYRAGDVVRRVEGGGVEFVGRVDHQVKVRGRRIELGEVEAALRSYAGVREAVVEVRADEREEQRLVGYVVWQAEVAEPGVGELRRYLRERLPEYMVPTALVVLAELPLMANGKVARRNLPDPDWTQPDGQKTFVAPHTAVEERLAAIWSEVLGVERISIDDNFFDMGGHSLLATQVMLRVAETFDLEVELQRLFDRPTVAGLAEEIEMLRWAAQGSALSAAVGMTGEREEGEL